MRNAAVAVGKRESPELRADELVEFVKRDPICQGMVDSLYHTGNYVHMRAMINAVAVAFLELGIEVGERRGKARTARPARTAAAAAGQ